MAVTAGSRPLRQAFALHGVRELVGVLSSPEGPGPDMALVVEASQLLIDEWPCDVTGCQAWQDLCTHRLPR